MDKDFFRMLVQDKRLSDFSGINVHPAEIFSKKVGPSCCIKQNHSLEHEMIANIYMKTSYFKEAKRLYLYNSTNVEMDMSPIIQAAFKGKKQIYMPKVLEKTSEGSRMEFIEIFPDTIYENNKGLLEPIGADYFDPRSADEKIEVVIPGICFDYKGNRLGYGGAYYDRYITLHGRERFHITGLAFDYQLFENLPVSEFDVPIDLIITNKNYVDLLLQ